MADDEFAIIDKYFSSIGWQSDQTVVQGPGDDCAILSVPPGQELLVSTDTLLSGVHFPDGASGGVVATRSFGAAVSDLAAMGAEPYAFTGALTMPGVDHDWLSEFSKCLSELSNKFELPLVGGNLTQGPLSITFTVMGLAPLGESLKRSGARTGDDIYVSGHPGDAGAGLELLLGGRSEYPELINSYLYPRPQIALGKQLRTIANAAIDISDGLAADLGHLIKSSGVCAEIDISMLPLSDAIIEFADHSKAISLALTAGDDYELCFTASKTCRSLIQEIAISVAHPVTRIGEITDGEGVVFVGEEVDPELTRPGFRHF
jgi:thiamine-monophosphate kinase